MAWFDKRKHSPSVSGDGIKRRRAKRSSSLLIGHKIDKGLIEEKETSLLILQSKPDAFFAVVYVLLSCIAVMLLNKIYINLFRKNDRKGKENKDA